MCQLARRATADNDNVIVIISHIIELELWRTHCNDHRPRRLIVLKSSRTHRAQASHWLTAASVLEYLQFDEDWRDSAVPDTMRALVSAWPAERLHKLLRWATGSEFVNAKAHAQLLVKRADTAKHLPFARTCTSEIWLPDDAPNLQRSLLEAMRHSGFNDE